MSTSLAKGGNVSLSGRAPGLTAVTVGLGWQADTGYDLDASALLCDASGRVPSDDCFVFFNNPSSPEGSVRRIAGGSPVGGDDQQILVDLDRVPGQVEKIVFPVSLYEGAARGQSFGQVHRAHIRVLDRDSGAELARYDLTSGRLSGETALVFGELYRHGAEWKFRAVGQGYASGLAGIAADYGVDVLRGTGSGPADPGAPAPVPPVPPALTVVPPPPLPPAFAPAPESIGSPAMTCFFDPAHGPGQTTVTWSPQWGVPRPVQACPGCAQRVQTTPPPFYTPPQQGYPQQGYPQQYGYGQPYGDHHDHGQHQEGGRRFGAGALIGAGAAGLIGGALLNEAFDDDEPDVTVNNYYED
ncbi:tellurium resistance protein TerD [Streptomyces sp. Ag109_O5-1]|uniref:TerD family protein n=1 Tax=Streptomyces sp. Ag109_O5-1 TaxID=1938851 RepID=UPI000F50AB7D|nr:TerD family protein [Streptomyces sp. Ag109_O5-1]RPE37948.1 tellurium resistance protein TerD [Streptomyces sp. Ag109_O5-1]